MADVIKHDGVVDSIEGDCIHVRIGCREQGEDN